MVEAENVNGFCQNCRMRNNTKEVYGLFPQAGGKARRRFFSVGYTRDNPMQLRYDMARQFDMSKAVDVKMLNDGAIKFNIYMDLGISKKNGLSLRVGYKIRRIASLGL